MKRAAALICAALVVVTAGVFAQTAPNFAGKWTRVADANGRAGGIGGLGVAATVVQDATSLTITRTTQMGEFTTTYKLDGTESKNTMMGRGGNQVESTSTAKSTTRCTRALRSSSRATPRPTWPTRSPSTTTWTEKQS